MDGLTPAGYIAAKRRAAIERRRCTKCGLHVAGSRGRSADCGESEGGGAIVDGRAGVGGEDVGVRTAFILESSHPVDSAEIVESGVSFPRVCEE